MTSIKKIERDLFEKSQKNFFMLWLFAEKGANDDLILRENLNFPFHKIFFLLNKSCL